MLLEWTSAFETQTAYFSDPGALEAFTDVV